MSDTKVEKPGEGEPSPNPDRDSKKDEASSNLPEGCLCTIDWREDEGRRWFVWGYKTECPVAPEAHSYYRPQFKQAIDGGFRAGLATEGTIIVDEGKVSVRPLHTLLRFV